MLLLLLSATAAPLIAVDVTGMEPQIEIVRHDAADRGWQITCEGHAGEEQVLRLALPRRAPQAAAIAYFERGDHLGSSRRFYYEGDPLPQGCDQEPPSFSASEAIRVLAFGRRERLTRLASMARRCGFTRPEVRERRQNDLPPWSRRGHDDWLTLDAGEDARARPGPLMCFIQMQTRVLSSQQ